MGEQRFCERLDGAIVLRVDVDPQVGPRREQLLETGDRVHARDARTSDSVPREVCDRAGRVGHSIEPIVVKRHEHAIRGEVHVGLDVAIAQSHGVLEGGHGVLGSGVQATTMRHGDRQVVVEERMSTAMRSAWRRRVHRRKLRRGTQARPLWYLTSWSSTVRAFVVSAVARPVAGPRSTRERATNQPTHQGAGTMSESTRAETDGEAAVNAAIDQLLADCPPTETSEEAFLGRQFDLGLAWVHFPEGLGGLGLSPKLQRNVIARVSQARGPMGGAKNPIGYGMCAPALVAHGTPEHTALLRSLFTNEHIWCQLFSEPGAGSDVASLACKAERDGDEWILNGQKVWTTLAHISSYGLIVARTDAEVPKHRGMTAFVIDMAAPGVEVRPLRQMTGEAEFNEVYFTDVRVPDAMRVDDVGRGWAVAITTLMNERVSIGGGTPPRNSGAIGQLLSLYRERADASDAVTRDRFMRLWSRAEINRITNLRASQNRRLGTPGPEGSIAKLAMADLNKAIYEVAIDLMGPEGMTYDSYEMHQPKVALFGTDVRKNFLRARANSIEGGTTEVMKNILGERVLGLPGDVRVDRDVAWSQVPRN